LLNTASLVLGAAALAMVLLAIWGERPLQWALTAVFCGIGSAVSGFVAGELPEHVPTPKPNRDQNHHLY